MKGTQVPFEPPVLENWFGWVVEIVYKRKEPMVPFEPPILWCILEIVYNYFTGLVINQSYKIGGSKKGT